MKGETGGYKSFYKALAITTILDGAKWELIMSYGAKESQVYSAHYSSSLLLYMCKHTKMKHIKNDKKNILYIVKYAWHTTLMKEKCDATFMTLLDKLCLIPV